MGFGHFLEGEQEGAQRLGRVGDAVDRTVRRSGGALVHIAHQRPRCESIGKPRPRLVLAGHTKLLRVRAAPYTTGAYM